MDYENAQPISLPHKKFWMIRECRDCLAPSCKGSGMIYECRDYLAGSIIYQGEKLSEAYRGIVRRMYLSIRTEHANYTEEDPTIPEAFASHAGFSQAWTVGLVL